MTEIFKGPEAAVGDAAEENAATGKVLFVVAHAQAVAVF